MKKKHKEKNWELESGFELRKVQDFWCIYQGGQYIEGGFPFVQDAADRAQELRKSRNEPK